MKGQKGKMNGAASVFVCYNMLYIMKSSGTKWIHFKPCDIWTWLHHYSLNKYCKSKKKKKSYSVFTERLNICVCGCFCDRSFHLFCHRFYNFLQDLREQIFFARQSQRLLCDVSLFAFSNGPTVVQWVWGLMTVEVKPYRSAFLALL